MKSESCNNLCSFILILFILALILMCLRIYTTRRNQMEKFVSAPSDSLANPIIERSYVDPCSPNNFKKHLFNFYKSAKEYRDIEKELHDSITQYEDIYHRFIKQQNHLEKHKETLNNCISLS